MQVDYKS